MYTVKEYQWEDVGVEETRGIALQRGNWCTKCQQPLDEVGFTGVGDTPREAALDAIERAVRAGWPRECFEVPEWADDAMHAHEECDIGEEEHDAECDLAYIVVLWITR